MTVPIVALGDVTEFVRGITFKPGDVVDMSESGAIACLRTRNVQTDVDLNDLIAVPPAFVRRKEQYLQFGDVLISSANSWNLVGKCCWIPELPWPASFGGFVTVIRPRSESVNRRYLFHWFSSERTQALLRSFGRRTTNISNLNLDRCRSMDFPLPPIAEQMRIADLLDAADALRVKRCLAIARLDTLTQAVFVDMFGETSEWPTGRLGDHVPTTSGGTPSRSRPDFFGGRIPWVKSGELAAGRVIASEETITEEALASSSAKLMPIGTVLLAMYGATVGEVAVLGVEAATNQAVCCISPTESVTGPFLVGLLRARKRDLVRRAAGGAQPNISQTIIRGLEIPLPPITIQEEYAQRATAADKLRESARSSEAGLEALFASLQQLAFRGEL